MDFQSREDGFLSAARSDVAPRLGWLGRLLLATAGLVTIAWIGFLCLGLLWLVGVL